MVSLHAQQMLGWMNGVPSHDHLIPMLFLPLYQSFSFLSSLLFLFDLWAATVDALSELYEYWWQDSVDFNGTNNSCVLLENAPFTTKHFTMISNVYNGCMSVYVCMGVHSMYIGMNACIPTVCLCVCVCVILCIAGRKVEQMQISCLHSLCWIFWANIPKFFLNNSEKWDKFTFLWLKVSGNLKYHFWIVRFLICHQQYEQLIQRFWLVYCISWKAHMTTPKFIPRRAIIYLGYRNVCFRVINSLSFLLPDYNRYQRWTDIVGDTNY